ncbi:MAG: glycosyltransferase family 4 protein [Promethearchaeota archaeon]
MFVPSHLTVLVGGGKFLMDYSNSLINKGHKITIITQKIDDSKYVFDDRIKLIEVYGFLPSNPLHWLFFRCIKKKFLKFLLKIDCDILISNDFPANYFCSIVKKKNYKIKHIFFCHQPYRYFHDKRFYNNAPIMIKIASFFLRILFKRFDIKGTLETDKIICNSNFTKKRIEMVYGKKSCMHYPVHRVENITPQEYFDLRTELRVNDKCPILFTLGLSHHLKGVKELIFIFYKVLKEIPNAILLIGGIINDYNKRIIRNLILKLKIPEKNIILYGYIDKELLGRFYADSTLTLYTAIDEPFGSIPIESMRNGTPVIAFEGGPSETIIDGKTGYLIKKLDLNDFARKVIKLIKNKDLLLYFSKNAKEHIKNNFDHKNAINNFESILYQVLSKK